MTARHISGNRIDNPISVDMLIAHVEVRIFSFSLLAFQTMWFLFVLPGHTRGLVSWTASTDPRGGCCVVEKHGGRSSDGQPTPEQKKNCAVCYYALGLTPPPILDLHIPDLGLLKILPLLATPVHAEQEHILTYYACGPPAVAFFS